MPPDPQQQSGDVDTVQHPTLGTLSFPKDMPMDQRNQMIQDLEDKAESQKPLMQRVKDWGSKQLSDFGQSAHERMQGLQMNPNYISQDPEGQRMAMSASMTSPAGAGEMVEPYAGRIAKAGIAGAKEGMMRTPIIGPALRKMVQAWQASGEVAPEAAGDFTMNARSGGRVTAPTRPQGPPVNIGPARVPKSTLEAPLSNKPVEGTPTPRQPKPEPPSGRWTGEAGARAGTRGATTEIPSGKTISSGATAGKAPVGQVSEKLTDKVAKAASSKSKVVLTPEEAQALDQRMKLAEQVAKRRGMQYAAGEKP